MKWSFLHKCEPEMTSTNDGKRRKNDDLSSYPFHRSSKKAFTSKPRVQRNLDDFTPIGMTYEEAFDYLYNQGLIDPVGRIQCQVKGLLDGTQTPIANTIEAMVTLLKSVSPLRITFKTSSTPTGFIFL